MEEFIQENGDESPFPKQEYNVPIAFTVSNGMCDPAHSLYNSLEAMPVYNYSSDSSHYSQEPLHMLNGCHPPEWGEDAYFNSHYLTFHTNIHLTSCHDGWLAGSQTIDGKSVARYHPIQKLFQCEICNMTAPINILAEHYFANHTVHIVLTCSYCPYKHSMAYMLRKHLIRTHQATSIPSDLAHEQPAYYTILSLLHTLKDAAERNYANTPPPSVSSASSESHFVMDSLTQPSTPEPQANGDVTYFCKFCSYTSQRKELFMRHENIHKDEKQFQCYVCQKDFTRADHVKKHILSRHKEVPYDVMKTRKGQFFKTRRSVQPSPVVKSPVQASPILIRKTPKKSFRCVQCYWRGNDNWSLKRHVSSHIRAFDCPLCDYNASLEERLASHVYKIHREYICAKCYLHSEEEEELKKHDCPKVETEAQRKCPRCPELCESALDVEVHCMTVHRMKLAECTICSKYMTTSQAKMCAHYAQAHPELQGRDGPRWFSKCFHENIYSIQK